MANPYYNPEELCLEIIDELEDPNLSYEFQMLIVWRHIGNDKLYYAEDNGCSCPTPFEFYRIKDLTEINDDTWAQFQADVESDHYRSADATECLSKVAKLLRANERKAKRLAKKA